MWQPGPPATDLALAGAQLLTNISASPFHVGRDREREEMFATRARDNSCFVAFCNSRRRPGRADLRRALARARRGGPRARAGTRASRRRCSSWTSTPPTPSGGGCGTCAAAALAARTRRRGARRAGRPLGVPGTAADRIEPQLADRSTSSSRCASRSSSGCATTSGKNGFSDVVVGVSGGIDSALTAALAVEALGAERVHCVSMPSRYSSEETRRGRAPAGREPRLPSSASSRSARSSTPSSEALAESFAGRRPTSPRRTCRRGSAASC